MTDFRELAARVDELEARLAFADDALAVLGAEVARQQKALELLDLRLRALGERIAQGDAPVFRGTAQDEIPPHW
jgi:SlyX protein